MNGDGQESLRGVIERITFHNEENGYTVAKLALEMPTRHLPHWQKEAPIVGNMVGINVGEAVELQGRWEVHPQYGKQFSFTGVRSVLPATVAGIERYLGSGLIRGVGPVTAKRVVAHFGERTLDIIEGEPERLSEVGGVGRKRVSMIRAAWSEMKAIKEVMIFLQGHGVSAGLATKIYKRYGDDAVSIVRHDPYRLAEDVYGIGFVTADRIAAALGIEGDAPQRIAAGVAFTLEKAGSEGHVYLPSPELVAQAGGLLDAGMQKTAAGVLRLEGAERVKLAAEPGGEADALRWAVAGVYGPSDGGPLPLLPETRSPFDEPSEERIEALLQGEQAVYLTPMYYAEVGVGNRLGRLAQGGGDASRRAVRGPSALDRLRQVAWEGKFAQLEGAQADGSGLQLVPRQKAAVRSALTHRLTVLTGGPGTGKTTVVRTILDMCEQAGAVALLAAPTGRAAKRMAEATGRPAKTVPPAVGVSAGRRFFLQAQRGASAAGGPADRRRGVDAGPAADEQPVEGGAAGDVLVAGGRRGPVAERGGGQCSGRRDRGDRGWRRRCGTVGGCGRVGRGRGCAPGDDISRQAAGSYIVENAHRINRGQMPVLTQSAAHGEAAAVDFFLFRTEEPERASELCVELVQERIPRRFGIAAEEIQVLSPMHRGAAGVAH